VTLSVLAADAAHALVLLSPLLGGSLAMGLAIRHGWWAALDRPVHQGWFGRNKTWRGIAMVSIGTAIAQWLLDLPGSFAATWLSLGHGFALGAAAMLAELPNSYAKRRLGIGEGKTKGGVAGRAFLVVDQLDLLAGSWLVLGLRGEATAGRVLCSAAVLLVAHPLVTRIGIRLGLRRVEGEEPSLLQ